MRELARGASGGSGSCQRMPSFYHEHSRFIVLVCRGVQGRAKKLVFRREIESRGMESPLHPFIHTGLTPMTADVSILATAAPATLLLRGSRVALLTASHIEPGTEQHSRLLLPRTLDAVVTAIAALFGHNLH